MWKVLIVSLVVLFLFALIRQMLSEKPIWALNVGECCWVWLRILMVLSSLYANIFFFILSHACVLVCLSLPSSPRPSCSLKQFFIFPFPLAALLTLLFCLSCFQINILLNFSAGEDCPCPEEIQDELNSFHDELRLHCGRVQLLPQFFDKCCWLWSLDVHTLFKAQCFNIVAKEGEYRYFVHQLFLTEMCFPSQEFPWRRKRKSRTLR